MYKSSDTPFPFWGAETKTKSGRDPLAIQNSSVVIYTNMIKGITNVTARVRYNGFYCWLLTLIASRIDLTTIDSPKKQIKYIRRGELLLAYSMLYNFPGVNGVSGSIFAQNHYDNDILNLAAGADLDQENKSKLYWQHPKGIFGQYYLNVLIELSLINAPDASHHTYRITEKAGKPLYEAFRRSLTEQQEDLFWESIVSGQISKSKLSEFKGIALHQVSSDEELNEYQKIFRKPERQDEAENDISHRISSIKLLLEYINGDGVMVKCQQFVLSFLKANFTAVLGANLKDKTEEQLSWFIYELNELSHAAYEAFHFAVLYSTTEEPQPLNIVLDNLKNQFENYHSNHKGTKNGIYDFYDELQLCYRKEEYGGLVYIASELIIELYKAVKNHIDLMREFSTHEGYNIKHTGFAPSLLTKLVGDNSKISDWAFAEDCIFSAINDHLRSSYSKSSIGQGIVHNYMVDDGLIWQLRRTSPIRTSPRLQNVLQYIEDMKWIKRENDKYIVTERGRQILKQR